MRNDGKYGTRCRHDGVAIVEFTIVVAMIVILIMATAEFARAFVQYNALSKSVRDGAGYVAGRALVGSTGTVSLTGGLQTEGQNLVVYGNTLGTGTPILPGLTIGDVTITAGGGNSIQVTAAYAYSSIFPFVPGLFYGSDVSASGVTLSTAITMRAL